MTAIDQAFIKAYTQYGVSEAPGVPVAPPLPPSPSAPPADAAEQQPAVEFSPLLRVDHFTWPSICRRLNEAAAEQLDRLTDELMDTVDRGQKVLAIAGCCRADGVTTLLQCVGRRMVSRGLKVILVDAHWANPQLTRRLGVLSDTGWEAVLDGRLQLEEAVIESTEDRLSVLPLCKSPADSGDEADNQTALTESIDCLAAHYDLVLIDVGAMEDPTASGNPLADRLDAVVLVHNLRTTNKDRLVETQSRLASVRVPQAGVIENFAA